MEFLIQNNLIENTSDSIAQFLFNGEGLNKSAIGTYLGEKYIKIFKIVKSEYTFILSIKELILI